MSGTVKTLTKVGRIHYINAVPFYHRLAETLGADLEYYAHYPTKINMAMRKKRIDVAPVSSLEYLNHQDHYCLLPGVAIGARDFSGSVILFSKKRIRDLNGATIALSRESLSSSVLLRILLKFKYKFQNKFTVVHADPEEVVKNHEAGLVIGDAALMYQPKEFVYKYDLSELWWNWTEKPFCFAVWAIQKEFIQRNPSEAAAFCRALTANRDRNLMDIESLIKETLEMDFLNPHFSKIFGYLFNLNYGLDHELEEGLQLFYRLAHRLGFSPKPKKLEYFDWQSVQPA